MDSQGGIAFSSTRSWGDLWETDHYGENSLEYGNRGNYGNFAQEPEERQGPLSVILARRVAKGRIVVVGDQNVFGNLWIRFGDNFKLFMNVFRWFSHSTGLSDGELFLAGDEPRILLLDNLNDSQFGNYGQDGLYHAYTELSRHFDTYIHDKIHYRYDLIILSPSLENLTEHQKAEISSHFSRGKPLVILGSEELNGDDPSFLTGQSLSPDPEFGLGAKASRRGQLTVIEDFSRIDNDAIASPYQEPTGAQASVANELVEAIQRKVQ